MAKINYQLAQGLEANIDSKLVERMLGLGTDTSRMSIEDNAGVTYRFPSETRIADVNVNFAYDIGYNGAIPVNSVGEALDALNSLIGLTSGVEFVDLGTYNFVASQHNAFKIVNADIPEGQASILEIVIIDNSSIVQAIGHVMLGSNNAGGSQSYVLDWSFNNIAYKYAVGDWELYTDTASTSTFGFGIKTGTNFNNHNVLMATIGAKFIGIDTIDLNVSTNSPTFLKLFDINNNTTLDNTKLAILNNLSDLNSASIARTNLGLGNVAIWDVGTSATNIVQVDGTGKLPAIDGSQLTNLSATDNTKLAILNDLNDLNDVPTARTNLGLGTSAVLDVGTGANDIVQLDGSSKLPAIDGSQLTNLPSGGNPSLGASGIVNVADGSGGWIALDGSASNPSFIYNSTTGNLSYTGGNFLIGETIQATDILEVTNDSGEIRFRDSTDSTTLARFQISKDSLGAGLHELYLYNSKRLTIPNDLKVAGDVTIDNIVDPATDTGKKMLVIDTTTKEVQERPIPTGGGGSGTTSLGVIKTKIQSISGYINVPVSTNIVIPFNTIDYSINLTGFNTSTKKWVCPTDGVYDCYACTDMELSTTSSGNVFASAVLGFLINGTTMKNSNLWALNTHYFGGAKTINTAGTLQLSQGDEVQVVFYVSQFGSGTNLDLNYQNSFFDIVSLNAPSGGGSGSDTKVLVQGQMNTTQSFTSTAERIDYVDSTLDVNNEWDNTTHRFTCGASGAGVYQFINTLFVDNANGWVQIFCKKNGVTQRITATDLHSSWDAPAGTTNIELIVGDYVEFWADSTTSFSVNATWYALNNFQITKISAVAPTGGVDVNAVHTNIANEITPLTTKANPHDDDVLIIEDSEDSNNKKSIKIGDLPNYRASSALTATTLTIDVGLYTQFSLRNISDTTVTIAAPTNGGAALTPDHDGQKLTIRLRDNGTSRTLVWDAVFRAIGVTLPTSTTSLKTIYVGCIYNGSSAKWDVVAVAEEA